MPNVLARLAVLSLLNGAVLPRLCAMEPVPAEDLFRAGEVGAGSFSPDGRHLGLVVGDGIDTRSLMIYDLKDMAPVALRGSGDFDVASFSWIRNDQVVFSLSFNKMYAYGLYSAHIDRLGDYTPIDKFNATTIVGVPDARPGKVLVLHVNTVGYQFKGDTVVEMDADFRPRNVAAMQRGDAITNRIAPPPAGTPMAWYADRAGEMALCRTWDKGRYHVLRYVPAARSWSEVPLGPSVNPMGMDFDDGFAWVVTYAQPGGFALRRCNLTTGALEEPVLRDPSYDISTGRLQFSKQARRLAGVSYLQRKPASFWFLRAYAVAQASMDKLSPGADNVLIDHDLSDKKFLFAVAGPQRPGTLMILDLEAKTLRGLGDNAPWLKDRHMATVKPATFKMRDGAHIEGYVTLPDEASASHPVPLVVLAHGGPWLRDNALFNPEVQFLASRGYAVLQVNYRGSTGYAPEISQERKYNFERMHEDVTDAARAFIRTGLVDPRRVAIMGGSFGGFLALAAVSFEGDLYRCAVSECGVFDWGKEISYMRDNMERGYSNEFLDEVDKPDGDLAHLDRISPVAHADQIHVPVLIAHGIDDQVVDVSQSKKLAKALKARGVSVETFFRATEGHGFYGYSDRIDYYHQVEAFLAANLGGASLAPK